MRVNTKGKITLCLLIGFIVFAVGNPVLISSVQQSVEIGSHDSFATAYTPHDAILLDGNDEMIAQATAETWPGDGSEGDPYQITGFSFYDTTHSVEIRNIDLHWTFTDNEVDGPGDSNVWCGVEISNSSNGYVADNVIINRYRGLWLIDIENVTITGNFIHDNLLNGIECVGYINGCLITDNTMTRNIGSGIRILTAVDSEISGNSVTDSEGTGVQVMGTTTRCQITNNYVDEVTGLGISVKDATSVEIMHNEISNAAGDGIYILGSDDIEIYNNTLADGGEDGMVFVNSEDGLIHNNSIVGTDGIGISVSSGEGLTFRFNHIEDATDYGLKTAENADWMEITQNVFINTSDTCQVCDEGENNTYIHNYYDDWVTPDVNSDLIVDVPYTIDGVAENEDSYPLADPNAAPIIPEEITTTTNSTTPTDTSTSTGIVEGIQIPLEIVMVAGGAVVIILVGVFFVKKRA
ncbi:MAG: right-handed parallel beta-helix repeat-containing protein [Candidatus Thorarchaeota archaeon]